jgi:hypothetical protein
VPLENHAGRDLVEKKGDLCERKNGNGVDPNRNWGVDWGKIEADYKPSEEAPGTHAFSEPESVLLRDIATRFKPHVWIGVHSGVLCWSAMSTRMRHSARAAFERPVEESIHLHQARTQKQLHSTA